MNIPQLRFPEFQIYGTMTHLTISLKELVTDFTEHQNM
jgi:hypothetical protein